MTAAATASRYRPLLTLALRGVGAVLLVATIPVYLFAVPDRAPRTPIVVTALTTPDKAEAMAARLSNMVATNGTRVTGVDIELIDADTVAVRIRTAPPKS